MPAGQQAWPGASPGMGGDGKLQFDHFISISPDLPGVPIVSNYRVSRLMETPANTLDDQPSPIFLWLKTSYLEPSTTFNLRKPDLLRSCPLPTISLGELAVGLPVALPSGSHPTCPPCLPTLSDLQDLW